MPPAVLETGKRNAEGLSAKLTEGVKETMRPLYREAIKEAGNPRTSGSWWGVGAKPKKTYPYQGGNI